MSHRFKNLSSFRPRVQELEDRTNPVAAVALSGTSLVAFDTNAPGSVLNTTPISGLAADDLLVGLDFRPQNGLLYGLAHNQATAGLQLYVISTRTGEAVPVGTAGELVAADGTPIVIPVGTSFGFDFNPTVDRIRIVTDTGLNFRMNPNNGALVDADLSAAGVQPDGNINGAAVSVNGTAYTNNAPNATATTQYTLDAATNQLLIQNPPNTGLQVNPLAVTLNGSELDFTAVNGFDIPAGVSTDKAGAPVAAGNGFALLTVDGATGFYSIDLATGAATLLGSIGQDVSATFSNFAVNPLDGFAGVPLVGVAGDSILRFSSADPTNVVSVSVSGLAATEQLVGLDVRPATGQFVGLAHNSATLGIRLVNVDPQTGVASALGTGLDYVDVTGAPILFPVGTNFGFDFNPTVDRIRIVASNGFNGRANPINGLAVDGDFGGAAGSVPGVNPDGNINSADASVIINAADATAYTNSFNKAAVTTQYTLDATTNRLSIQAPPNNGTQISSLPVRVLSIPADGGVAVPVELDFSGVNGFEIPANVTVSKANTPASGFGLAALVVEGSTKLYSINLLTGIATPLGLIGDGNVGLTGLASADVPARSAVTTTGAFAVGSDAGSPSLVRVFNADQSLAYELSPYGSFTGGDRVATADFNNDGIPDLIVGGGPGVVTNVRIYDGATQAIMFEIQPFEDAFRGGVFVSVGDINGDGIPDFAITPDQGGGGRVRVFNGANFQQIDDFFGIEDLDFRGGARVAINDVTGDGFGDVIVAAGFGGGPRVATFSGASLANGERSKPFGDFFAFEPELRNGVFIAAGDLNGDRFADIIAGGGPGGGPRVFALSGADLTANGTRTQLANFFAGDNTTREGIRVASKNPNGFLADILVGSAPGSGSQVIRYAGGTIPMNGTPPEAFAFEPLGATLGGVFVG